MTNSGFEANRREQMKETEWKEALQSMARFGEGLLRDRGGDFSFGEWAGESEGEIIELATGLDPDKLSWDEVDELCLAFFEGVKT